MKLTLTHIFITFRELPNHLNKIFEPKAPIKVKDLGDLNIEALLSETFTTTEITVTGGSQDVRQKTFAP